ncbi:MAG TPA: tetraacyldisaccharide 4'-kinase [Rubrivivax sp.]|nr:tetraacyldisaccharide 4'-kinase [Rubrivivax sp.]
MTDRPTLAARAEALLAQHWWQPRPSGLAQFLRPLSWLYRALAGWQRRRHPPQALPVPVIVVGNFIVGGAGKTPTVIALVQALAAAGWHPGVISRGYGRRDAGAREVAVGDPVAYVGDEPLLIRRRTGVPVWVGRDRVAAARALCARHRQVDVIVADDGLQHHALPRRAELVVFDERGAGNGLLLPAGPLREPLPRSLPARTRILYTGGIASTVLPGELARRSLGEAWPLAAWASGDRQDARPLADLHGRLLLAAAGLAAPEKFFAMLEQAGLTITRLPLPDHHDYATLPWPAGTAEVVTTEKDAVKIDPAHSGATQVWVVPLDLALPASLVGELMSWLPAPTPP